MELEDELIAVVVAIYGSQDITEGLRVLAASQYLKGRGDDAADQRRQA